MDEALKAKVIAMLEAVLEVLNESSTSNLMPMPNLRDKVAYLHHKGATDKGAPLTLGESLDIRRTIYGPTAVRGSAGLFGSKGTNHILYRNVPHGKRRNLNQEVLLTSYGLARAKAYAKAHGLAA